MSSVLWRRLGCLLMLFLGYWPLQDPDGFGDSAKAATTALWDLLMKLFDGVMSRRRVRSVTEGDSRGVAATFPRRVGRRPAPPCVGESDVAMVDVVREPWVLSLLPAADLLPSVWSRVGIAGCSPRSRLPQ